MGAEAGQSVGRERFKDPALDPKQLILRVERLGLVQTATLLEEFEPLL
jgi:hypothetical protein